MSHGNPGHPGPAPLAADDRVRHKDSGYIGTVQRCEIAGIVWVCAVVFDASLQKILPGNSPASVETTIAADELELLRRGAIRLVVDNTPQSPFPCAASSHLAPHPEAARNPARPPHAPSSPQGCRAPGHAITDQQQPEPA